MPAGVGELLRSIQLKILLHFTRFYHGFIIPLLNEVVTVIILNEDFKIELLHFARPPHQYLKTFHRPISIVITTAHDGLTIIVVSVLHNILVYKV